MCYCMFVCVCVHVCVTVCLCMCVIVCCAQTHRACAAMLLRAQFLGGTRHKCLLNMSAVVCM